MNTIKKTKITIEYNIINNVIGATNKFFTVEHNTIKTTIKTTNQYIIKNAQKIDNELVLKMKNETMFILADYWYINQEINNVAVSSKVLTLKNLDYHRDWIKMRFVSIDNGIYETNKLLTETDIIEFFNKKEIIENKLEDFIYRNKKFCLKNFLIFQKTQREEILDQLENLV
jgi:hypothetical protein